MHSQVLLLRRFQQLAELQKHFNNYLEKGKDLVKSIRNGV
jgi:hypothetical protein